MYDVNKRLAEYDIQNWELEHIILALSGEIAYHKYIISKDKGADVGTPSVVRNRFSYKEGWRKEVRQVVIELYLMGITWDHEERARMKENEEGMPLKGELERWAKKNGYHSENGPNQEIVQEYCRRNKLPLLVAETFKSALGIDGNKK